MWLNFVIALACAAGLLTIAWGYKGRLLTPVRYGKNTEITILVRVEGAEPNLEQTLKGFIWMDENGTLTAPVKILLNGADSCTVHIADTYARNYKNITVSDIGDTVWKNSWN